MQIQLITSDQHTLSAYRSGSPKANKALVLLQEIFGINDYVRQQCELFAQAGYEVIAPALFDRAQPNIELGYSAEDVQEGLKIRAQIPLEQTLIDIQASIDTFKDKPVGVVGYCWGGTLSWLAACQLKGLSAASCWYGGGIAEHKDLRVRVPVQMHFGELDKSIPMDDVTQIRLSQAAAEVHVYPLADHGFGCSHRAQFQELAFNEAQRSTLAFFDEHLK